MPKSASCCLWQWQRSHGSSRILPTAARCMDESRLGRFSRTRGSLLDWLDKGGFPPEPNYPKELGREWNSEVVRATCKFALSRANDVLADENEIPSEVPFCLTCISCQNDGPASYLEATSNGWQAVQYIPNSISTAFLGICPSCVVEDK
jgi:hypothetical protein